jgi:selenide,water dikinase
MAVGAGVEVRVDMSAVPLLPGAREHALAPSFGGLERNQAHFLTDGRVRLEARDEASRTLALDPQTSGGLVIGVPQQHAREWDRAMRAHGVSATRIGDVAEGSGVTVTA